MAKHLSFALLFVLAGCATEPLSVGAPAPPPVAAVYWALNVVRPANHPVDAFGLDCNDYSHAAFLRLQAEGKHPRYLVGYIPDGRLHMLVENDGWAFDSLQRGLVARESLRYRWLELSDDGLHWFYVKPRA